jgi:hypothetical protein
VQPDKLADGADLDKNTLNFFDLANRYLNEILNSIESIPRELRLISALLQYFCKQKFPNSVHTVVGGFFFLRLVCPAIVSPEGFGIVDSA